MITTEKAKPECPLCDSLSVDLDYVDERKNKFWKCKVCGFKWAGTFRNYCKD